MNTAKFALMVYTTGINAYFNYQNQCPKHWQGLPEEEIWGLGWKKAETICKR